MLHKHSKRWDKKWQVLLLHFHIGKRQKLREITRYLSTQKKFKNCLDIGTGTGAIAEECQRYGTKWTYLEVEEEVANEAKKILGTKSKFFTSVDQVQDERFDLVTIVDTFFYFKNPDTEIRKLRKLLTENGRILITLTDGNRKRMLNRLRDKLALGEKKRGFIFQESPDDVIKRFKKQKFTVCYFKRFSNIFTEIILLFLDISQTVFNNLKKTKVNELTNTSEVSQNQIFILRLLFPFVLCVSSLDFLTKGVLPGYKFIVVVAK